MVDKTATAGPLLPVTSLNSMATGITFSSTTATDYVGNYIYATDHNNTMTLLRILLPEGYYQGGVYYYYLKDHLGNNRVVIDSSGTVVESSSYYPSGMRFGESVVAANNSVQPYRHTGHEMQAMHGLNWIDNGARFRTVSGGDGFLGIDLHAEKYYSESPYIFAGNNPINAFDPDGQDKYFLSDFNPKEENTNLTSFYQHLNVNNDPTEAIIVAHGFAGRAEGYIGDVAHSMAQGKEFNNVIEQNISNQNRHWGSATDVSQINKVLLLSCKGGDIDETEQNLAQKISVVNNGIWVTASIGNVTTRGDGTFFNKSGWWVIYFNGKLMNYATFDTKTKKFTHYSIEEYTQIQEAASRTSHNAVNNYMTSSQNQFRNSMNSGQYNTKNSDGAYSDDFLKWWYQDDSKKK